MKNECTQGTAAKAEERLHRTHTLFATSPCGFVGTIEVLRLRPEEPLHHQQPVAWVLVVQIRTRTHHKDKSVVAPPSTNHANGGAFLLRGIQVTHTYKILQLQMALCACAPIVGVPPVQVKSLAVPVCVSEFVCVYVCE